MEQEANVTSVSFPLFASLYLLYIPPLFLLGPLLSSPREALEDPDESVRLAAQNSLETMARSKKELLPEIAKAWRVYPAW